MSFNLPFTALSLLHDHLTHLVSTNDDKFDFLDTNRIPYAVKFNREIPNYFTVADENGYVKVFKSYPKLKLVKEFSVQNSCIYDLQWLNSHEIACGGGDKTVNLYDLNTGTRTALLKGHTESVKSVSLIPNNQFVIASGSRDGSVLIFDTRFNRHQTEASNSGNEETCASIKSVNQIQIAHFIDSNHSTSSPSTSLTPSRASSRATAHSNILKSKSSSLNQSHHHVNHSLKRPSPIACVAFQNEHLLVSAGATDGLIKVWDIRKIYSSSSAKKHIEPLPLYIFDNQLKKNSSTSSPTAKLISKGYSNLMFNSYRSKLYANCLNGQLYEYNFATYNQNHTRSLSSCHKLDENNKVKLSYHTNQSNFIKASLSQCENFLLTGSSDFNAYIYATNVNSTSSEFRKKMPVIVLKGHTNEVTAVDWNPYDSNQLITCSDDNTMRMWSVKRDLEEIKSNECNFSQAEAVNTQNDDDESNHAKFTSTIRSYNRVYNKYLPNTTGIFDDVLFLNYEYKKFMRPRVECDKQESDEMQLDYDLEKELCIKCQNISIDNEDDSVSSKNLKSIENDLNNFKPGNNCFLDLETPLSNLPVNLIDPSDVCVEAKQETTTTTSKQSPKLNSFALLLGEPKPKTKTIKKKVKTSPKTANQTSTTSGTPLRMITKNPLTPSVSTSKKRSWDASDKLVNELDEAKTPRTKRRLIMGAASAAVQAEMHTVSSSSATTTTPNKSSNKTILHYFSPVFQPK